VRYLLSKGAKTQITDAGGKKPIDLVAESVKNASAPPAGASGAGGGNATPASAAEIRSLLQGGVFTR